MLIISCMECQEEFNLYSQAKIKAGGLRNQCSNCAVESTTRYAGVQAADGKQSQITILKFESDLDRETYLKFWQNNSGLHKSKSCQLGQHLSTTPDVKFKTVSGFNPTNHKGKL